MGNELSSLTSGTSLNPWITSGAIFVVALIIGLVIRRVIWSRLEKFAASTEAKWDDFVVEQLSAPVTALIVIGAFGVAGQSTPEAIRSHPLMTSGVHVALIAIAVWMAERWLAYFFRSDALPPGLTSTTRALLLTIGRVILLSIGLLIILDTIGVSITPLLASLGVGSVAVALALQDTLSNFFGGLYLLVDKPIRIDDFVKIDDTQGYVVHIGWRSTRLRLLNDTVVTVPNTKVAGSLITNFDVPNPNIVFNVECGVAYGSDLEKVERVALEVSREIHSRVPVAVASFETGVRFHTFADSSVNFTTSLRVKRYEDLSFLRHEFIKALHARFQKEGIEIPFPQRVVHLEK